MSGLGWCCAVDQESRHLLDSKTKDEKDTQLKPYGLEEETTEKETGPENENGSHCSGLVNLTGFTVLALLLLFRSIASLSSQLAGGKTNIFQLNSVRYAIVVLLVSGNIIWRQTSLRVEAQYICRIMASGFFNFIANSGLFFALSFMPVGNVEAMYLVLYIFISTVTDFIRGRIQLLGTVSSIIAIVGLFLLAQPWKEPNEKVKVRVVPCDYWEGHSLYSSHSNETIMTLTYTNVSHVGYNVSNVLAENGSSIGVTTELSGYFIYIDGVKRQIPLNPLILGYIITFVAATAASIRAYIAKGLRGNIPSEVLIFWFSVFEGILALIVNIIWTKLNGATFYGFPDGPLCLTFTLSYCFLIALAYPMWVLAVGYFNVSKLALGNAVIILVLYACQRTFLKKFHPGEANLFETFGILVIFCSLVIAPLSEYINVSKQ